MSRFSFRAGPDAEDPIFTITQPDRRDRIRRLTVGTDGSVTEDDLIVPLPEEES